VPAHSVQPELTELTRATRGIDWSVSLRDAEGFEVATIDPDDVLSTASIGKLLLLIEIACRYETGSLDGSELLSRLPDLAVADSGLWQHLRVDALCVEDLAVLVGSVSDNLATNVLLHRIGLENVQRRATTMNLSTTALLDRVRRHRGDADPPRLSEGSARELSGMMAQLSAGALVSEMVSACLNRWLSAGTDLSMVAAPFGLDPLAHVEEDRGILLLNKTGTDAHVRADVGFVRGPKAAMSYAVIANWKADLDDHRDAVLDVMRGIGTLMLRSVT
jgi:beta-lactamase class A